MPIIVVPFKMNALNVENFIYFEYVLLSSNESLCNRYLKQPVTGLFFR